MDDSVEWEKETGGEGYGGEDDRKKKGSAGRRGGGYCIGNKQDSTPPRTKFQHDFVGFNGQRKRKHRTVFLSMERPRRHIFSEKVKIKIVVRSTNFGENRLGKMCVLEYPKIVLRVTRHVRREIPVPSSLPCVSLLCLMARPCHRLRLVYGWFVSVAPPLWKDTPREFRRGGRGFFFFF